MAAIPNAPAASASGNFMSLPGHLDDLLKRVYAAVQMPQSSSPRPVPVYSADTAARLRKLPYGTNVAQTQAAQQQLLRDIPTLGGMYSPGQPYAAVNGDLPNTVARVNQLGQALLGTGTAKQTPDQINQQLQTPAMQAKIGAWLASGGKVNPAQSNFMAPLQISAWVPRTNIAI
jgi:hypothetical protein